MLTTPSNPVELSEFDNVIALLIEERHFTNKLLIDLYSNLRKLKQQPEKEEISTPIQEPISILEKLYFEIECQKENNRKLDFITTQLKQII